MILKMGNSCCFLLGFRLMSSFFGCELVNAFILQPAARRRKAVWHFQESVKLWGALYQYNKSLVFALEKDYSIVLHMVSYSYG
jgi:hypothetical protein